MLDATGRELLTDAIARAEQRASEIEREIDFILQCRPSALIPASIYDDHLATYQQMLLLQRTIVASYLEYLDKHNV